MNGEQLQEALTVAWNAIGNLRAALKEFCSERELDYVNNLSASELLKKVHEYVKVSKRIEP